MDHWDRIELEQYEAKKQAASSLGLDKFDAFFLSIALSTKGRKLTMMIMMKSNPIKESSRKIKTADLNDIDFLEI